MARDRAAQQGTDELLQIRLYFTRADPVEGAFAPPTGKRTYRARINESASVPLTLSWSKQLQTHLSTLAVPGPDDLGAGQAVRWFGDALRRFLAPVGWRNEDEKMLEALARDRPVQLTLCSEAAELYALPWELLTSQRTGGSLGANPRVARRGVRAALQRRRTLEAESRAATAGTPHRRGDFDR